MKILKYVLVLGLILNFSCKSNQTFLSQNARSALNGHHRLAVLPFKVVFTDEYKSMTSWGRNRNNYNWEEQERLAGLELQKVAFLDLAKRAAKKGWQITVQDFLTTNKILESNHIGFSELQEADKAAIARILNVDAVIWGVSSTQYSLRNYGRNGVNTEMMLYDGPNNELVWKNGSINYLTYRMDTPASLSSSSVSQLIGSLPYIGVKK